MFVVTAVLALNLLPHIRSVKVVIDGTIDFGPNWNFGYKLKPLNTFHPRKRTSNSPNIIVLKSNNVDNTAAEHEATSTEILEDVNKNHERVAMVGNDSPDSKINERVFQVTKLFKTEVTKDAMFKYPRKIKDETDIVEFVEHIRNESLTMFDKVRERFNDKTLKQKIDDLKQRYANKFNEFENETKQHTIRTTLGNKNVVLNTIDYSNKLVNRLVNRFKIDIEDSGLRSGLDASRTFQEHKDNLTNIAYKDACSMLGICRAGKEFSDHISDLITTLLEHNDVKVQLAVAAVAKALKRANFDRIMDAETHEAFTSGLSSLEELNPFELRVLLMAYKLLIDNRHQPFLNRDHGNPWIKATVAMFHVMEGFNKKVIIENKEWSDFKKDFSRWLADDNVNITDVTKKLVHRVENKIAALDNRTASDFKAKLRLCVAANQLRISLSNYVQFQPFVI